MNVTHISDKRRTEANPDGWTRVAGTMPLREIARRAKAVSHTIWDDCNIYVHVLRNHTILVHCPSYRRARQLAAWLDARL